MATEQSTQTPALGRVEPLSDAAKAVLEGTPIVLLTGSDRLLMVKEALRACGLKLEELCVSIESYMKKPSGGMCSYSRPHNLPSKAPVIALCTLSCNENMEELLLVTPPERFLRCEIKYTKEEVSSRQSQKVLSWCTVDDIETATIAQLFGEQDYLCIRSIMALQAACRAKVECYNKLSGEFGTTGTEIGKLIERINFNR